MQYCAACAEEEAIKTAYEVYVTESLRLAAQSKYIATPFVEMIHGAPKKVDNRTAEEVVADICESAGIVLVD